MAAIAEPTHIESRAQSATTLRTVVELVRRITHSDVASIVTFSLPDKTITWRAVSGFRSYVVDEANPIERPLANEIVVRAIEANETVVLEGIGERPELPAGDFPVHTAEGICNLALTPLSGRGHMRGALILAYRGPHSFSDEEKRLLEGLAAIAL